MKITNSPEFFQNIQQADEIVFVALKEHYEILHDNFNSTGSYMHGDSRPLFISLYKIAQSFNQIYELQPWKVELLQKIGPILFKQ